MARAAFPQTSFTGGELSPRVMGRTDMDRYQTGLKRCFNAYPVVAGGVKRRGGTLYEQTGVTAVADGSVLVPFVAGNNGSFVLEFSNLSMRVLTADGALAGVTMSTPYTTADLELLDWAQSDTTLYIFSPARPIQTLRRFTSGAWQLAQHQLTQAPFDEVGLVGGVALTLSASTVGTGRTVTAGAAMWLPADVGRTITLDGSQATITGYTSSTVVTADITISFPSTSLSAGTWTLDDSPNALIWADKAGAVDDQLTFKPAVTRAADITLSATSGAVTVTASAAVFAAGDVGKTFVMGAGVASVTGYTDTTHITVTTSTAFTDTSGASGQWGIGADAFRSTDVGSILRYNGGLARITAYTNGQQVAAKVLREITSPVAAPALSWSLEAPIWSDAWGYPRTGTVFQQRLIAGGTTKRPRTIWGSRTGEPGNFERWTDDADSFAFEIDSDEATPIVFVTASTDLVVLTQSGEYSVRGGVEKPLTPTSVRVKPESSHGSAQVRPATINKETIFIQRSGRKARALGYRYDFDGYSAPDITVLADHVTKPGVRWLAYAQEPEQVIWAGLEDGTLASCTFDRDQQPAVIGWAPHSLNGFVECGISIPYQDRDWLWVIVRRTVNGSTVRYIERLDETFVPFHPSEADDSPIYGTTTDCSVVIDNAGGQSSFSVPHLAGRTVDIVADGAKMPRATVAADGSLTISRPSKRTLIGLPFRTVVTPLTPEFQTGEGAAQGQRARTSACVMRFLDTIGAKIISNQGFEQVVPSRSFGVDVLDQPPPPFSGLETVSMLGWDRGQAELSIVQDDPMPMHLLSIVRTHTVNAS